MSGPCFSASVGGHPLRPPTRRRLGGPLPHQLADGSQTPPKVDCSFPPRLLNSGRSCGISSPFELVSHASGQVIHALLTRSPLGVLLLPVRLACIKHAASVHPEPGSNSPQYFYISVDMCKSCVRWNCLSGLACHYLPIKTRCLSNHSSVVKVHPAIFDNKSVAPQANKSPMSSPPPARDRLSCIGQRRLVF